MHTIKQRMRQPFSRGSPRPRGYIHQPICSFIFFIKKRVLTNITAHSWPVLSFLEALRRETLLTSTAPFRILINQLIEEIINNPFGHIVNLNYYNNWLPPISGRLRKILPSILFLKISSSTAINVPIF